MSIEGNHKEVIGVNIENSNNVLVERIQFRNGRIGTRFVYSEGITVRYIDSYNTILHGISSKDCSGTNDVCSNRTHNFSVYSNIVGGASTDGNGIDLHSENGEVAGNYSYKNIQGNKFPDARNIWIHNNVFENNIQPGWVVRTYSIIRDPVENQYYFNNIFRNNSAEFEMVIFSGPAGNINNSIFLIDNFYEGSDATRLNKISHPGIQYNVCENTQDYDRTPTTIRSIVSDQTICTLGSQITQVSEVTTTPIPDPLDPIPRPYVSPLISATPVPPTPMIHRTFQ